MHTARNGEVLVVNPMASAAAGRHNVTGSGGPRGSVSATASSAPRRHGTGGHGKGRAGSKLRSAAAEVKTTVGAATLKRLPFQIRLESLSARGTKNLLYITYLTLLVAVVLTATDKLNFDKVRGPAWHVHVHVHVHLHVGVHVRRCGCGCGQAHDR